MTDETETLTDEELASIAEVEARSKGPSWDELPDGVSFEAEPDGTWEEKD